MILIVNIENGYGERSSHSAVSSQSGKFYNVSRISRLTSELPIDYISSISTFFARLDAQHTFLLVLNRNIEHYLQITYSKKKTKIKIYIIHREEYLYPKIAFYPLNYLLKSLFVSI